MDKITNFEKLIGSLPAIKELNINLTNILAQVNSPTEMCHAIEKTPIQIAAIAQDFEDSKKFKPLLRAVKKNTNITYLNISENYMSPACFHSLRDVFL